MLKPRNFLKSPFLFYPFPHALPHSPAPPPASPSLPLHLSGLCGSIQPLWARRSPSSVCGGMWPDWQGWDSHGQLVTEEGSRVNIYYPAEIVSLDGAL